MSAPSQDGAHVQDIRGVLIQVGGARLLLPNATISEVLSYADPEPIVDAPAWLLGRIRWRGWQLPLVAFARIAGIDAQERGGLGSKVIVLKALGDDAKLPHFALLTQGFPRLVTVSRDTLVADAGGNDPLPMGVQARVLLNDDAALIPDIAGIERAISLVLVAQ
jgi:chemosensory pili system protein ChpC